MKLCGLSSTSQYCALFLSKSNSATPLVMNISPGCYVGIKARVVPLRVVPDCAGRISAHG